MAQLKGSIPSHGPLERLFSGPRSDSVYLNTTCQTLPPGYGCRAFGGGELLGHQRLVWPGMRATSQRLLEGPDGTMHVIEPGDCYFPDGSLVPSYTPSYTFISGTLIGFDHIAPDELTDMEYVELDHVTTTATMKSALGLDMTRSPSDTALSSRCCSPAPSSFACATTMAIRLVRGLMSLFQSRIAQDAEEVSQRQDWPGTK